MIAVIEIWALASLIAVLRGATNIRSAWIHYVKYRPSNGLGRQIATTAWRTQVALFVMSTACLGVIGLAIIQGVDTRARIPPIGWVIRILILLLPAGLALIGEWQHRLMRYVEQAG